MKSMMERLKDLRIDNDLSQKKVAAILDTTQQQYSKYENENIELPLHQFIKLADYYNVSADYLIGTTDVPKSDKLKRIYLTTDYTCSDLLNDVLSLDGKGKAAVVDYVNLQKLRKEHEK